MSKTRIATVVLGAGLAALAGCQGAHADATPPPAKVVAVTVSIAAATLAEDCARPKQPSTGDSAVSGARQHRSCRQTSVQLALAGSADGLASPFTVVKAQLFDASTGKLIGDMTTRNPQVWSDTAGRYQPWDQLAKPSEKLQVTYDMNAPDWSKAGGSQRAAQGKSFRLVMTVSVGGKETKIQTTAKSAELMIAPPTVT